MVDTAAKRYWEQRLAQHFGPEGVGALAYGGAYNVWLYRVRRRRFHGLLRRLGLQVGRLRILDVGSGTGFYIKEWRRAGAKSLVGCDISTHAVNELSRKYSDLKFHELDVGDADATSPLVSEQFDVVSAFDILFHITDDQRFRAAITNLARLIRPGGLLIYSDNFLHQQSAPYGAYHYSRSLDEISEILAGAGFEILERRPIFYIMNSPVDSKSVVARAIWDWITWPARRSETYGNLLGATLYPFELALTAIVREGPSTEVAVCRRHG